MCKYMPILGPFGYHCHTNTSGGFFQNIMHIATYPASIIDNGTVSSFLASPVTAGTHKFTPSTCTVKDQMSHSHQFFPLVAYLQVSPPELRTDFSSLAHFNITKLSHLVLSKELLFCGLHNCQRKGNQNYMYNKVEQIWHAVSKPHFTS
jgi:hypothetical protein